MINSDWKFVNGWQSTAFGVSREMVDKFVRVSCSKALGSSQDLLIIQVTLSLGLGAAGCCGLGSLCIVSKSWCQSYLMF